MRFKPLLLAAVLIAMNTIVVGAQSEDRIFYLEGNGKGARDPEIWVMDLGNTPDDFMGQIRIEQGIDERLLQATQQVVVKEGRHIATTYDL